MPADLLLEIGTEEIPAGFLARAIDELAEHARARLADARLGVGRIQTLGTPRRLVLAVAGLADGQPDVSERVVGPPAQVAFDASGAPTKAAVGFAKRNGVDVSALARAEVEGKKGEYVVCTRHEAGRSASEVLPGLLGELIAGLSWPKSMRWGYLEESFVRPVHWLVALLGDQVLPISFAGIRAGNQSRGHRFLAPEPMTITSSLPAYLEALRERFVIADPATRRDMIQAELARIESETGARVRPDAALLDEVINLMEYPAAVCGSFDQAFLEVPEEVIVSAMRAHLRYFALEDADGKLVNRFVTIAGTITRDLGVVRAGNERVLAARLADARFFFREDQKVSLEQRVEQLDKVVFQTDLGSIGAKTRRIGQIAGQLAAALVNSIGIDGALVARAALLCKADLVTQMVYEFPDLQGVMGRHYARIAGEPQPVCDAIFEHYLPRGASDVLPRSDVSAVVGIADRMDTLVGCFAVGLAPSGSADPYGLRRAALGILTLLLDRGWSVPLSHLVDWSADALAGTVAVTDACKAEVLGFLRTRLKGQLGHLPADCVEAALTTGFDDVPDARARAAAVATLRERADFEPLAVAFKRVANILKGESVAQDPAPDLFTEDEERALWAAFGEIESRVSAYLAEGDYGRALAGLAELEEPVARFFDKVLVMDEDARVRANRLALLGRINGTFTRIADFRQLAV